MLHLSHSEKNTLQLMFFCVNARSGGEAGGAMMSAAASFVRCSPKVVSPRRSKNNSKVKGIRLLLDPPSKIEGCPKGSKEEKSSFFSGISP